MLPSSWDNLPRLLTACKYCCIMSVDDVYMTSPQKQQKQKVKKQHLCEDREHCPLADKKKQIKNLLLRQWSYTFAYFAYRPYIATS